MTHAEAIARLSIQVADEMLAAGIAPADMPRERLELAVASVVHTIVNGYLHLKNAKPTQEKVN